MAVYFTLNKPTLLFIVAAAIILGGCAWSFTLHWLDGWPTRDIWQHIAAVRALMSDLHRPSNPFVNSTETSRHFHPYWALMACLARTFRWSAANAVAFAGFVSATVLVIGFYEFGRAYFRSSWGPLVLMLCCVLGWSIPLSHTGFISVPTLLEGIGYPAPLLVGLSMVLWSVVIKGFGNPWLGLLVLPLAALMFSIHQLGATIGFVVAISFIVLYPGGRRHRMLMAVSLVAGVLVSCSWIYFNPVRAVLLVGNPTWRHGVEFYSPLGLARLFIPSALGLIGLLRTTYGGERRPLLVAMIILLAAFATGPLGVQIASRFGAAVALLLQVGIASIIVPYADHPAEFGDRFKLTVSGVGFGAVLFQALTLGLYWIPSQFAYQRDFGNAFTEATTLAADIPDGQEIAAYDVAAWPLVAAGHKVLSVPWPEPFIADLGSRQNKIDQLFSLRLSREQRSRLATSYGVRTLILDIRYGPPDSDLGWGFSQLKLFSSQARKTSHVGPLWRFDL